MISGIQKIILEKFNVDAYIDIIVRNSRIVGHLYNNLLPYCPFFASYGRRDRRNLLGWRPKSAKKYYSTNNILQMKINKK